MPGRKGPEMKKYTFKWSGKTYTRANKRAARRAWKDGKTIVICPCNMRPDSIWSPAVPFARNENDAENIFDVIANECTFHACMNKETGKYPAFYTEI